MSDRELREEFHTVLFEHALVLEQFQCIGYLFKIQ